MAKGIKIADFFAKVGFKVDTQELKKIDSHLKKLGHSFEKVGSKAVKSGKKIEQVFSGLTLDRRKFGVQKKIDLLQKLGGEVATFKRRLVPTSKKSTFDRLSLDIDKAIHKQRQLNQVQKAAKTSAVSGSSVGKFSASGFFEREANIRSSLRLSEKQRKALTRLARIYEKQGMSLAQANAKLKDLTASRVRDNKAVERQIKRQNKLNFAQVRALGSLKQLVGGYVSVFTAMQSVGAIKRVGQDLESARAGMSAVSGNSKGLAKDLAFVDKHSVRLGLDLAATTKDFVKLRSVSKGMTDDGLADVFLGVAEAGTVLQLSSEDMKGALRALQQMMSKGRVNAEDFRQQLAERLPIAFEALEKATGLSGVALEKAMRDGKLLASEVLPKLGRELRKVAQENDALNRVLNTSRVAENRLTTAMQKFMNVIFTSGFGEALTQFFNEATKGFQDLEGLGKAIGVVFKGVTKTLTIALNIIATPLKLISGLFTVLNRLFGETYATLLVLSPLLGIVFYKGLKLVGKALGMINKKLVLIIAGFTTAIVAAIELYALMTKGVRSEIEMRLLGGRDVSYENFGSAVADTIGITASPTNRDRATIEMNGTTIVANNPIEMQEQIAQHALVHGRF